LEFGAIGSKSFVPGVIFFRVRSVLDSTWNQVWYLLRVCAAIISYGGNWKSIRFG